jgi:hypothetical protein
VATAAEISVQVAADGSGDYLTIQDAIAHTSADDDVTIRIAPGVYGPFAMNRAGNVLIRTTGELHDTVLEGVSVVDAEAALTIDGVAIADRGADVQRGSLSLTQLRISHPGATTAPALRIASGATANLDMVLIEGWSGADAPVMAGPGAIATFDAVGIFHCEGSLAGAILSKGASMDIHTLLTIDTRADSGAGSFNIEGGTVTLADSRIEGAEGTIGGGLRVAGDASVAVTDLVLEDNDATGGGHIRLESGTLRMTRITAVGGSATYGGTIWQSGGDLTIRNARFSDGYALTAGAAVFQQGGSADIAFATWTGMGSGQGIAAHTELASASYHGVIIADVDGPAFQVGTGSSVTFTDGLLWEVHASAAVQGDLDYEPNATWFAPRFADVESGDFALRAISAGIDLGVGGLLDLDGTAADAGMYGGPDAWVLDDLDGDGFVHGRDCVDTDATINESRSDKFYDGVDSNCDEQSDFDQDGDGFDASLFGGLDCDDTNLDIHPDSVEAAGDKVDSDCDGFANPDADGDGWPVELDCDDQNADVAPDAEDTWYDGIDQDCSGNNDFDLDGDGYESAEFGGTDCDDTDPHRHPNYPDFAGDGIDQDCDGVDAEDDVAAEDEVTVLEPASPTDSDDGSAPEGMGTDSEPLSAATKTGCSTTGNAGSAPFGIVGFVSLFGLMARRRD